MTISNTSSYSIHIANGSQKVFEVKNGAQGIYFADDSELAVTSQIGTVITASVLNVDYTVSGAGTDAGRVTFLSPPINGSAIKIVRNTPLTQPLNLTAGGVFSPSGIMSAFDRQTRMLQDVRRDLTDLSAGSSIINVFDYTFDTGTTDSDPGTGKIRLNNANLALATQVFVSETDRLGISQAVALQSMDDGGDPIKGYLTLIDLANSANKVRLRIVASLIDAGQYDKIAVVYESGVTSLAAGNVGFVFERSAPIAETAPPERRGLDDVVLPRTHWIEMEAFQPGIVSRETQSGTIAFTAAYVGEKINALYQTGVRRLIIVTLTDNLRTYTKWPTYPFDVSGTATHWWRDDVSGAVIANVDDFDVLAEIMTASSRLDGMRVVIGLGRHGDLNLINDCYTVTFLSGADPLRFGKTLGLRITQETERYATEAGIIYGRFGAYAAWGGFYISHESDHLQSSGAIYTPIANALRGYGEVHIAPATPIDLANTTTIQDVLNEFHVDWIWAQTSAGYGYNWTTGLNAHISNISIFGSGAHLKLWRDTLDAARLRSAGAYTPRLGVDIEAWRIGVQGVGILTFAATTGTNILVTLGTSSSVVTADIGKSINVRSGQTTGVARVVSITNTTQIRVDITENLANVNVASGFWALVPDLTDATADSYPALASEVAFEIKEVSPWVDDVSIYAEAYWDPGNLSLRMTQTQAGRSDWRDRATAGWISHQTNMSSAARFLRQMAHSGWLDFPEITPLTSPTADRARLYSFDQSGTSKLAYVNSAGVVTILGTTTAASVTAGTNAQNQGVMTADINIVTTAAANPSGVTLPVSALSRRVLIINKGANAINVYPATGASIDALAANASVQIPTSGVMMFTAASTTQWYSSGNSTFIAPTLGTPVSGTLTNCTGLLVTGGGTGAATARDAAANLSTVWLAGQNAVAASVGATTSETVLATIALAAAAVGINGHIRVTTLWSHTNNANNKTLSVRFGAAGAGTGGASHTAVVATTTDTTRLVTTIWNRNSASSQVGFVTTSGGFGSVAAAPATSAINTANAADVILTGTKANSADTLTLEAYTVELFFKA